MTAAQRDNRVFTLRLACAEIYNRSLFDLCAEPSVSATNTTTTASSKGNARYAENAPVLPSGGVAASLYSTAGASSSSAPSLTSSIGDASAASSRLEVKDSHMTMTAADRLSWHEIDLREGQEEAAMAAAQVCIPFAVYILSWCYIG
jgi:hypothetical protein